MTAKSQQCTENQLSTSGSRALDEYCRYFANFSKVLGTYVKLHYPQLIFDLEHLLDASFTVWQKLSDEEKVSLAQFLEDISNNENGNNQNKSAAAKLFAAKLKFPYTTLSSTTLTSSKNGNDDRYQTAFLNTISMNSYPMVNDNDVHQHSKSIVASSKSMTSVPIKQRSKITPFHIFCKDERKKLIFRHNKLNIRDINHLLSEKWKKLSIRMRKSYEYRAYLTKKHLFKRYEKDGASTDTFRCISTNIDRYPYHHSQSTKIKRLKSVHHHATKHTMKSIKSISKRPVIKSKRVSLQVSPQQFYRHPSSNANSVLNNKQKQKSNTSRQGSTRKKNIKSRTTARQ
ncbi:unnamed protein product [Didymodactylos carnosus]|uniref:HMG box domain-containing protein n=1 Tax=Didymodactylos carnosus TaxID=1234261 RepID=A0A815TCH8_9BILA|nr:unnamed protein product [Didymodactylos carnosus]CAF1503256.1 unnamed protein product [Didymodactylos carnosus]CAF4168491.1 unnamed protein product [Didymodactylos carnosus]CAF4364730.1 unnamed protein product [Didymodactylos carnosus]